jgi:arginine decarboxylase-like protein
MGIFKNIWNSFFGKPQKQEEFERAGSIEEIKLKVVYKKGEDKTESTSGFIENELMDSNQPEQEQVQELTDPLCEFSKPKNKSVRKEVVNPATLSKEQEVLQYLLKYGSIDKRTCAEKFGLKRLDNLICELRKKGMNIKNETVELHNELGEKTKVNNYRLVTSDATN